MERYFVLNAAGEPTLEPDLEAWSRWYESANRTIARTLVGPEVAVLTTFLGVDEREDDDPPRLFETRVYGGVLDGEEALYTTREEALAGHAELAQWCRIGNAKDAGVTPEMIA